MAKRILVIDDDPDIGLMIKLMLEFRGYWVKVTDRAEHLEEIVLKDNIDIIIMDMLLSGVNGVDICRQLKSDPRINETKIIMISAHPNAKDMCLLAGADEFLAKPFDMEEIITLIRSLEIPEKGPQSHR